ncbi:Conserved_hypothetical protein [Hexamita inflata]|uniref:Leucine-rich repeat protein n=1 Tax=Hexamita inflata TaxID=28002 RepID=A0AA86UZ68_9EUKA|nr:Conserved hypothetical protein [Hexamita inflata]
MLSKIQNQQQPAKINEKQQQQLYEQKMLNKYKDCEKDGILCLHYCKEIGSLEFIENFNIQKLRIEACNQIIPDMYSDAIRELYIIQSRIATLNQLCLSNLKTLSIIDVPNILIESLDYPKLKKLILIKIELSNISFLSQLITLTQLNLSDNKIYNISTLKHLINLQHVDLSQNYISDISSLQYLIKLTYLDLGKFGQTTMTLNKIQNIVALKSLIHLKYLDLSNNNINDINVLENLTNLTELNLSCNQITDIVPLQNLKNITNLKLDYNILNNVDFIELKLLKSLQELSLSYNQITDARKLLNFPTNIRILNISNNQFSDISTIRKLKQLTKLNASNNILVNVDALEELNNITHLDISKNSIIYVYPLLKLIKLYKFKITDNKILDYDAIQAALACFQPQYLPFAPQNLGYEGRVLSEINQENMKGIQTQPSVEQINFANNIRTVDEIQSTVQKIYEKQKQLRKRCNNFNQRLKFIVQEQTNKQIQFTSLIITLLNIFGSE